MTKQEVENQINEFLKIVVYEAQFLAFKNKLFKNNKNNDLENYIKSELQKISKRFINGKYTANNKLNNMPKVKLKKTGNQNNNNKRKVINEPPQVFFNYKNHTYISLSNEINTPISVFEILLKQKNNFEKIIPNEKISIDSWLILEEFVLNKYKIVISQRRKCNSDKIKITNRKFRSTTPDQFRGGNFGKIIYIGKIN